MWQWEQVDEGRSGASGDLARLFKNEEIKEPGLLGVNAPSADATLMAREVIQNSWDAARELADQLREDGDTRPQFEIEFRFEDLEGDAREQLITNLDLADHAGRLTTPGVSRAELGIREDVCLDRLETGAPLPVLRITESGTTGMYGPWSGSKSKMYLALVSLGFTVKRAGAGGSYGYGKAGLIRGSAIRSLVAYTCFRPTDDEAVTRRLLGMTYWGPHQFEDDSFTGFARLGITNARGDVEPYTDADADDIAAKLDLRVRRAAANRISDLGTTFLLLDPTCTPGDLCTAIERNWWPALIEDEFAVTIVDQEGNKHHPQPKRQPDLAPFIRSFERVTLNESDAATNSFPVRKFTTDALTGQHRVPLGALGLESAVSDWSYPKAAEIEEQPVQHRSLVALVRGPRMVVEYFQCGTQPPFVRGTFVADQLVDDLLRQTEPKAHDAWETKASDDAIDRDAPKVAASALRQVRAAVDAYRKELKPALPKLEDVKLKELSRLFGSILDSSGNEQVDLSGDRLFVIRLDEPENKLNADGDLVTSVKATIRLGKQKLERLEDGDTVRAEVRLRFLYLEDETAREEIGRKKFRIKVGSTKSERNPIKPGPDVKWVKVSLNKLENGASQVLNLSAESEPYLADSTCRVALDVRLDPSTDGAIESESEGAA
jgi:hypothetical protein